MKILTIIKLSVFPVLISCLNYTYSETTAPDNNMIKHSGKNIDSDPFEFNPHSYISLYHINYILPFYYTGSPYQEAYRGHTPGLQSIDREEVKFQLSLLILLYRFADHDALNIAYTQASYWQLYNKYAFFRETDYQPEIIWSHVLNKKFELDAGLSHQSNGKGNNIERSWNRAYLNLIYKGDNYYVNVKSWALTFKKHSTDLHNPDIGDYLGHGDITFGYKVNQHIFTVTGRNLRHPTVEATWNFPVYASLHGFFQFFSGYGQSLMEYNHHTNSAGVGIALNTGWML